ncbi:hypothetical protein Dimus_036678 [Dionaea muscipula]
MVRGETVVHGASSSSPTSWQALSSLRRAVESSPVSSRVPPREQQEEHASSELHAGEHRAPVGGQPPPRRAAELRAAVHDKVARRALDTHAGSRAWQGGEQRPSRRAAARASCRACGSRHQWASSRACERGDHPSRAAALPASSGTGELPCMASRHPLGEQLCAARWRAAEGGEVASSQGRRALDSSSPATGSGHGVNEHPTPSSGEK